MKVFVCNLVYRLFWRIRDCSVLVSIWVIWVFIRSGINLGDILKIKWVVIFFEISRNDGNLIVFFVFVKLRVRNFFISIIKVGLRLLVYLNFLIVLGLLFGG